MRVIRIVTILGGTLLLLGVASVAFLLHQDTQRRTATLSNGTVITVEAVIVGTNRVSTDGPIYKAARKYLPTALKGWVPPSVNGSAFVDNNSITLYIRQNPPIATGWPWDSAAVFDVEGFKFEEIGGSSSIGNYHCLTIRSFPRREPEFVVHLEDNRAKPVATFRLPNPIDGPFPEWKPVPLPQIDTNGPVQLALKGGRARYTSRYPSCNWETALESTDELWRTNGKVRNYWLTDATGNHGSFLSPKEPAWKVHFQCFRSETTAFRTNETWLLQDLEVPTAGAGRALLLTNTVEGVRVAIQAFSGASLTVISNRTNYTFGPYTDSRSDKWSRSYYQTYETEEYGSDCPVFLIMTDEVPRDRELLFRFWDVSGNLINPEPTPYGYHSTSSVNGQERIYAKRIKTKSAKVSLEVIVNRGLEFEFLISPQVVQGIEKISSPTR